MRISDWSSDVCSSDLHDLRLHDGIGGHIDDGSLFKVGDPELALLLAANILQHQYVSPVGAPLETVGRPRIETSERRGGLRVIERRDQDVEDHVQRVEKRSEESRVGEECVSTC